MSASKEIATDPGKFVLSSRVKTVYAVCMFIGLLGFAITLIRQPERAWMAYLIGYFYFTTLALGGLFLTAIHHVTKAGWSVNIRRLLEALTAFLPIAALAGLAFLFGAPKLYTWLDQAKVAADHILQHKSAYLNQTFFIVRMVAYFALWLFFGKVMIGRSLKQDQSGDVNITHGLVKSGVIFLLVFAITYSLFSVDLLMSVDAHWFSTIFGVYTFAGLFQSTIAFTILLALYLRGKGLLRGFVTDDHMHDLGKYLFAFTVFWAYIAFSQYMLIWYANLPEETIFIIPRSEGEWAAVSLFLLIGKFIVPFIALLPRWAKRTPVHLAAVSILIMLMQYVDLYWLVYPAYLKDEVKFSIPEIAVFLGFFGLFLFTVTRFLSRHSLVPLKDPRIHESMHHHVVY